MSSVLIIVAVLLFLLVLFLISAIKVAREYERGIVFRLGRLFPEPKGPGLFILIPVVDRMVKVDLRTVTLNIPPQEVITKDNVPARVNAVAYFRIVEPKAAIVQIENFMVATSQIAQTTLRAVLGQHVLRRAALRARQDQRDPANDHRRGDHPLGDKGRARRGQGP
jgi:regulator of protease activity HflC (stomatin/prohibitin superfamily)